MAGRYGPPYIASTTLHRLGPEDSRSTSYLKPTWYNLLEDLKPRTTLTMGALAMSGSRLLHTEVGPGFFDPVLPEQTRWPPPVEPPVRYVHHPITYDLAKFNIIFNFFFSSLKQN